MFGIQEDDVAAEANLTDKQRAEVRAKASRPDNLLGPVEGSIFAATFTADSEEDGDYDDTTEGVQSESDGGWRRR